MPISTKPIKEYPFQPGDLALCPQLGTVKLLRRGNSNYWVVTSDFTSSYHRNTYEIPPKLLTPIPPTPSK
jgi:hypothetical protein